jgi:hypothetical protein
MAQQMGIGKLGAPRVILKRKFRFTLEISTPCGFIPKSFVKSAARPNIEIEETELHFLNAVTWIPGKGKWQPIQVTYYDAADQDLTGLYSWLATVYDFTKPVELRQSEKAGWAGTALLTMYDGCGNPLEFWLLQNCFPTSVNFGELAYEDSMYSEIQLTLRYSDVIYAPGCRGGQPQPCCIGC